MSSVGNLAPPIITTNFIFGTRVRANPFIKIGNNIKNQDYKEELYDYQHSYIDKKEMLTLDCNPAKAADRIAP